MRCSVVCGGVGYRAPGRRATGGLEECSSWSGGVVRGGPLGVIYLRYQGGVGSLIDLSFGTFSLGGWGSDRVGDFVPSWLVSGGVCLEPVVYLSRVVDRLSLRSLSALVSLGVCWRSRP